MRTGEPSSGWSARRGRHAYRLEAGQTLRLELPEASGTWTRKDDARELVVETGDVLRGHRDALLVRVTLEPPTESP